MAHTRRGFINNIAVSTLGLLALPLSKSSAEVISSTSAKHGNAGLKNPLFIYNNWASYDELSDNIKLTGEVAMKQLEEVIRLKKNGLRVDAYLMDMFWVPTHRQYVRVAASSADRLSRIRRVACEVRDLGLVSLRERCC